MTTRHKRIKHWDDERADGNSLIVTLQEGWAFYPSPDEASAEHVRGFDTVAEAMARVRRTEPCSCARCKPANTKEAGDPGPQLLADLFSFKRKR
jgi:hypothetical protein